MSRNFRLSILEISALILCFYIRSSASEAIFKMTRLGNCPGENHLDINVPDMRITQVSKTNFVVNGEMQFLLNITKPSWVGKISILRCPDSTSPETRCSAFISDTRERNVCKLLQDENAIYSKFMKMVKPRIKCPVAAGIYKIEDCPIYSDSIKNLPILTTKTTYILVSTSLFYEKRKVMCAHARLSLTPQRIRG